MTKAKTSIDAVRKPVVANRVKANKSGVRWSLHRTSERVIRSARAALQPSKAKSKFHPIQDTQIVTLVTKPTAILDHAQPKLSQEADSIIAMYMRDACEVALITPKQEIELAARIKKGDAAAREHMIRANLRFVIKIARQYENFGLPLLDLINEGNIGLMRAVDKFDPKKGGKLSTYAVLWIKQQIRRALASQGKTIRLPVHIANNIYQLTQAEVRLRNELGRDASDEELADNLRVKISHIVRLRRVALRPTSLDAPLGDQDSSTIAEVVADETARTPFEQLRDENETQLIRELVTKLPEREATIIRFRFGLDSGQERTLEDVGKKFNLTRERIRQLQNLALLKLRQMLDGPESVAVLA